MNFKKNHKTESCIYHLKILSYHINQLMCKKHINNKKYITSYGSTLNVLAYWTITILSLLCQFK